MFIGTFHFFQVENIRVTLACRFPVSGVQAVSLLIGHSALAWVKPADIPL